MAEIASPCTQNCRLTRDGKACAICRRTLPEIEMWAQLTAEQRTAIMADLPNRKKK